MILATFGRVAVAGIFVELSASVLVGIESFIGLAANAF
jgi:hypothetical protein